LSHEGLWNGSAAERGHCSRDSQATVHVVSVKAPYTIPVWTLRCNARVAL